jgi:hypothetical protein
MGPIAAVLLVLLAGRVPSAINIVDVFFRLPAKSCFDMSVETRRAIVSEYLQNGYVRDARMFKVRTLDPKNGYLRIEGGFEGTWEMCLWDRGRGRKTAAVCFNACGPVCRNKDLAFFLYADGKLAPDKQIVLPRVEFVDFFKDGARIGDVAGPTAEPPALTYQLPRQGKDIVCRYEWSLSLGEAAVKKYLQGDKLDLIWENGAFTKGPVHW